MIETRQIIEKIRIIPKDDTLYLLEKLPYETGLFASNGNVLYIVSNTENCSSLSIKTEYLRVETNIYVSAFNPSVSSFEDGYYNYVELQMPALNDFEANLSTFLHLCLAHATYNHGEEFMSFFDSLVSLFQLPREQQYKNLVGLIGELFLIEYAYQNFKVDLSLYWHTDGSTSRLDFVCPNVNFEVKTTQTDSLSFIIKHDQFFLNSEKNYLVAVAIEENNSGRTLEELITSLLENTNICNTLSFSINIEKEKRRVSPFETKSRRFILKKIKVYPVLSINPFENVPDNVEELSYKLNLLPFNTVLLSEILT